ncbi:glutathione S-transferase [Pacificibacter marinus]|uniref:Putative GST-like protein YibF n=1 Tax=Pacificibacter marinus TaxID=658057 RepID=A0A1Y5RVR0_9RHOB|nr:glutathione S-transferase N-terminal domain-containing protein [Pacificibacter marinus]SEK39168.1 Glutathione S-transferase, N-terminal domain [Pacificibacter marinus]SLN25551.1 putative GST-like protein YibF [Pacificibacter marinus]
MKLSLYWGSASPFVRKVMVVAHMLQIEDSIEVLDSAAHPTDRDTRIQAFNPLAKVPAARTEDGVVLYDSRVICEYLDTEKNGGIVPRAGAPRWTALQRQALADGLLDAALLIRYETLVRPEPHRWPLWIEKQTEKIMDALDAMDADIPDDGCQDIGAITYACALGWLNFRFPELNWQEKRPALAHWHAEFEKTPALIATRPTA